MIQTTIDTFDYRAEKETDVPGDVLAVVKRADLILREQFRSIPARGLQASWCRFEKIPDVGWCVSLQVFTPTYSYGQQIGIDDLRDAGRAKNHIWDVLDAFAQTYSDKIDEQLRQIRVDLKQLLTAEAN